MTCYLRVLELEVVDKGYGLIPNLSMGLLVLTIIHYRINPYHSNPLDSISGVYTDSL